VELDGCWWTPPLEAGCLPGVERARLLEMGRLQERVLRVADLERAEGVAVLSSLRGWRAAELSTVRRKAVPNARFDHHLDHPWAPGRDQSLTSAAGPWS
jgi:para-aminobenzoate synthetase/4-amino-4-deoxychorismate lyase